MVNVFVKAEAAVGEWIHALAIPLEDIDRLALRPLKWLRFVTFTVVGARGHLFDAPDGDLVDYENVSLANIAENANYYFAPEGIYHLADLQGLNDHITSSSLTQRGADFREHISDRDGDHCVATAVEAEDCDAAHIIPLSKGDEYLKFIVSDRNVLYEGQQLPPIDINSIQNGMFLSKLLHSRFGSGRSAFLKTPNFALNCADIPRVEIGAVPTYRVTVQHLKPYEGLDLFPQRDVRADWSGPLAPPSILLDYVYGVAAIRRWAANDIQGMLNDRHQNEFRAISPLPSFSPPSSEASDAPDSDDTADGDYAPPGAGRRRGIHKKSKESELSHAMDFAFRFSMFLKGYAPGTTLAMVREKQEKQAELHSREVGVAKVQSWLDERASTQSETLPQLGRRNSGTGTDGGSGAG